ncbi:MAG: zinc-ribbon and DUF3426 domain-containing protein [Burkholderiaceae bacterium]|nr:zinc-ribbon and DUF3426 domain-containing protein [Burkholderiaceae bacterium]
MTLVTTCPVCKTSFKVIPDQLKLRRGLVRCGSCHNVFSGIDHLRQVNDEPGSPQDQAPELSLAGAVPAAQPAPASEQSQGPANPDSGALTAETQPELVVDSLPEVGAGNHAEDLAEAISEFIAENATEQHDEAMAESSANTQSKLNADSGPGQNADTVSALITESELEQREESAVEPMEFGIPPAMRVAQEDAIDFFSESAQRRIRWWPRGTLGKTFAIVLLVTLALQLALALRSEIVARFAPARAALEALADPLGLKVELPRNPQKITIEIDLSIGDAPDRYRMNALLRSHSETALQWPAIEISLTDANGATVVRRVLMPTDYLADQATIVAGLPGRSEQNLRVDFLLRDVVLTGYSAVLFYP